MALRRRQQKSSAWTVAFFDGRGGRWLAGHAAPSVPVIAGYSEQWWAERQTRELLLCSRLDPAWGGTKKEHSCCCGEEQAMHSSRVLQALALSHTDAARHGCVQLFLRTPHRELSAWVFHCRFSGRSVNQTE